MKVTVDGVVFENSYQLGIRRLFSEVLRRNASRMDCTLWLRSAPVVATPPGVRVLRDRGRSYAARWNLPGRVYARYARSRFPREICAADVFHSTYFTPCPCAGPAVVVSVYDMVAEKTFGFAGGEGWADNIIAKRAAIRAATLCIAISEATAADLVSFYPEMAGRVRVVPLGADHLAPGERPSDDAAAGRAEPFALFVGQRLGYKNFHAVLEALRSPAWPAGVAVAIVGAPLADYEQNLIDSMGLTGRVRDLGPVRDTELRRLYAAARCFVFPSMLEGFGLPVLEAQTNGCPVVCSDIPVFREVAGSSAVFFDPRLGEQLAVGVAAACEPDARRRLAESGRENARRFSWDRTAAGCAAVYEEAVRLARR